MNNKKKVVVITGGSSGIGKATATALAAQDCIVYELSRHETKSDGIYHITADVTKEHQVKSAIQQVMDVQGSIDILICNAGFGISGAVEYTESEAAHKQLEVNLFGVDNVVRAVLPCMRAVGNGRIICVSSIAGILPIPFQTWYSVSKSAIIAYALALQNEVRPYGITVCSVLPGDIRTGFTAAREKAIIGDDVYGGRITRSVKGMEKDEMNGMSPEVLGRFIARCALKRRTRPMMAVGLSYKACAMLAKCLPRRLSNWIVGILYAR